MFPVSQTILCEKNDRDKKPACKEPQLSVKIKFSQVETEKALEN